MSGRSGLQQVGTDPNDKQDAHETNGGDDSTLEPRFAILEIETCFGEVTHQIWLTGEFFANSGAHARTEGGKCETNSRECTETQIRHRIITVETDIRWNALK